MKKTKILLFFHGGSLNRGAEAIIRTAANLIKEKNKNVEVHLASMNPESDEQIPLLDGIQLDSKFIVKKYSLDWIISVFKIKVFGDESYLIKKRNKQLLDLIPQYDMLLSTGGDNYCYGEQPETYVIDGVIKKSGKKLVLWGASVGEEDLSTDKILDLKSFDLVLARETYTQKALEKNGLTNVKLCADGAFTLDKEELELPEKWLEGNTLGFNFSPLVWKKNKNSREASLKLIQHIIDHTDMNIALIPHVIEKGNDDYEVLKQFYEQFKNTERVFLLPNNLNAIQYKGYISRLRFFIGARTHATIAAYSSLVPTMVLGYSIKSKGIAFDIFGEEKLVLDLSEISDSEKLIANFKELLRDEKTIALKLAERIPEIQKMSRKAVNYLLKL